MKHWAPSSEAVAETFRRSIDALSRKSQNLESFHRGLASLVQGTSAKTMGNSRPKRPAKSAELEQAEQMVNDAITPLGSVTAARRVMRLKRGEDNHFRKITADWESLYGQRKDKQTQKVQVPRHEEHVFSLNAPAAASECIRTYYENLFNSRMWNEMQYQCWYESSERYLSDAAQHWDKLHVPMSTVLDCWRGVKNGKTPGKDGITNEVLAYFNWETLARLRGLFEKRLNNEEGGEVGDEWFDIDIQCMPKKPNARNLGDWRPISLLPTLQKFYNAVTAKMYDDWIELPVWMAGFMEGRQTLELSFAIQQAFEKSRLMGKGCWVGKLDVRKAFDNMDHPEFASLCTHYGIHPSLILSTLREWQGARTTIDVSGFESKIKMLACGRQGGRDTPKLWNVLLFLILKDQVEEWETTDMVWSLEPRDGLAPRLNILAWADDLVIFANSKTDLTRKFTDILRSLRNHRLDVKPDSLEWTCTVNHHFYDGGTIDVDHETGPVQFDLKPKGFNILGVWLDPSNNNESIWRHRLMEAQRTWMGLKEQLCRRRAPLRDRVLRWQATVGKTLLWGCGAWTMTKDEFLKIQAFQLRCFRHMWGRRARLDELWSHACIRLTHNIKITLKKWNVELVADTAMKMHHSWAGHAARLPREHFLHDLLRYRSRTDVGLRCVWGYAKGLERQTYQSSWPGVVAAVLRSRNMEALWHRFCKRTVLGLRHYGIGGTGGRLWTLMEGRLL